MCAAALHAAFPRWNAAWLAPVALAGLFATWATLPPRAAALTGYVAGLVFFSLDFSWFGETAGKLVGPFAFVLDLGPAIFEALAFALAGAIASLAWRRPSPWAPIVAAAGFTVAEWLRSSGLLGVPFYQIGVPFAETPLAPLAAFVGGYGLTFAVAALGAALAAAVLDRARIRFFASTVAAIAAATALAWWAWPARTFAPGYISVAAVQGNIKQELKWSAPALALAVDRYTSMTAALQARKPALVVWPETVITTNLAGDPQLQARFGALARRMQALLVVGSVEASPGGEYNDLFFFDATGTLAQVYRKRQLVPFAEYLPGPSWLRALPGANLVSNFKTGTDPAVVDARLGVAPLICWESVFGDLAQAQAARGARVFAIATDDAWFGSSDGPYAHAQVATLRAVETGRWVVRAAATGISGIIAPDGSWRARSGLETQETVAGAIGDARPTLYARLGPHPIGLALVLLTLFGLLRPRRRA